MTRITGMLIGPPGTGKSWALGSVLGLSDVEKGLLLAPKPREASSHLYVKAKTEERLDVETFSDPKWAPVIGRFEAEAFKRLFTRILELYEDDTYDAILLDPFTDVSLIATHHLLAPEKVATPGDLDGKNASIAFYGALKNNLKEFTQSLVGLASPAAKRPKHVLVAVHAQPTKEEDLLGKQTPEGKAKGVSFLGDIMAAVDGGYRQEIAAEFDIVGFTQLKYALVKDEKTKRMERQASYVIQINADPERHAKVALVPRIDAMEIPNSIPKLMELIEEARR